LNAALAAGFADPVHEAQRAFRAALDALARPGRVVELGEAIAGLAIPPAMARLLLALTDDDTGVWWQRDDPAMARWLRFHTGAAVAARTDQAAFAVVTDPPAMPPLAAFAQGTAAAPEFSTTLLIEVPSLDAGTAFRWHGPGIREPLTVRIAGMSAGFWATWQANHAAFPQGVDLIFTCGCRAIGLPRTTRVGRLEGI
jgi:alpha-D-ribose 1-methylphosphonate 5-triphosphate synthase subunit PhnH